MAGDRPRRLQSVSHALQVLGLFSPANPEWSVTRVAETLNLNKSTASRLLATMSQEGYVSKDDETGRYELGLRAYAVGLAYLSGLSLRRAAIRTLEELAFAVHETVYLGVLGDGVAIYIEKILSPLSLRVDSHIGLALPLHATAMGKVLLAAQPDVYIDALISRGLRQYTRRTLTRACKLQTELQMVRRRGYALDLEEFEDNLHCIALPIYDHRGSVAAAFSISGPAVRLTQERMEQNLPLFRDAAVKISSRLGFKGDRGDGQSRRESPERRSGQQGVRR